VQPGLGQQQVRNCSAGHAKQQRFALKKEEVWDWRFKPRPGIASMFSVTFGTEGKVPPPAWATTRAKR
jgi:hypothetical protein